MKKLAALSLSALLALAAGTASAENRAAAVSLSPFIGGYTFDGSQHLRTRPVYGLRAGYDFTKNIGLEGVFDYVNAESARGAGGADAFRYGLDGLYNFLPGGPWVPYLAAGVGGTTINGPRSSTNAAFNYGGGLKYFITDNFVLRGDVRHIIVVDPTKHNLEYTAGISYLFGGKTTPPHLPAPPDADHDGVVDIQDRCPDTPAGVSVDSHGCPVDSDRDGVPDYLDKCPGTPAGVKVDAEGCPLDSDRDGVADYLDKCPGTPAGAPVDGEGCPLDTDGDGVADYLDKCPNTPPSTPVNSDGCNVEKLCITLNVQFDTEKADIKPQFHDEIARAGNFLKKYPFTTSVIEGHTDNVGAAEYNEKLSLRRAESVRKYLVEKFGIDGSRLTAKGYGLTRPVADNATEEGRQKNRRIDAVIDCVIRKQ
jgi:OmpA-OmpF porin, OOP family